jgi:hypothetical protein
MTQIKLNLTIQRLHSRCYCRTYAVCTGRYIAVSKWRSCRRDRTSPPIVRTKSTVSRAGLAYVDRKRGGFLTAPATYDSDRGATRGLEGGADGFRRPRSGVETFTSR